MLQAVERWKAEINQMIMSNMQAAMSQAEGYVERLEQEILELQRRDVELRQILETEDNIHFLQVPEDCRGLQQMFKSHSTPPQWKIKNQWILWPLSVSLFNLFDSKITSFFS